MIVVVDDKVWAEYHAAKAAHAAFAPEKRPHSHFSMSMEHLKAIDRLRKAVVAVLGGMRGPRTADRPALFAAADAVRSRERVNGPKPKIKDPLTDR